VTYPVSIDYEIFIFQFAAGLFEHLMKKFETSIQQDLLLLNKNDFSSEKEKMVILYNLE